MCMNIASDILNKQTKKKNKKKNNNNLGKNLFQFWYVI